MFPKLVARDSANIGVLKEIGTWCRPAPINALFGVQWKVREVLTARTLGINAPRLLPATQVRLLAGLLASRPILIAAPRLNRALPLHPKVTPCMQDTRLIAEAPKDMNMPLPLAPRNPLAGDTILHRQSNATEPPGNLCGRHLPPPKEHLILFTHPE